MKFAFRIFVLSAVAAASFAAFAQTFHYSNLESQDANLYAIDTGPGTLLSDVATNAPGYSLTADSHLEFFNSVASFSFSSGTAGGTAVSYSFTYDVLTATPVNAVDYVVNAFASGDAVVNFSEDVVSLPTESTLYAYTTNSFMSTNGSLQFSALTGSAAFTLPETLYRVKKVITIVSPTGFSAANYGGVSLVEQTQQPVPEPAALAAIGIGVLGLLVRRKKA